MRTDPEENRLRGGKVSFFLLIFKELELTQKTAPLKKRDAGKSTIRRFVYFF
jgi:hypothetical protein